MLRQQANAPEALSELRRTQSAEAQLPLGQLLERQGDKAGATAALAESSR